MPENQASNLERSLARLVADLEEETVLRTVEQRLQAGDDPLQIINECNEGMREVGLRYEKGEFFLAGLIMSGEIFREVVELVLPRLQQETGGRTAGRVLVGTVSGDIHDIGKNMFATALRGAGFSVVDLGVDVPPERFVTEVEKWKPAVVGLSGLIWTAVESMHRTVELLRANENRLGYRPPVILGGGVVDGKVCRYCGADSWSTDAMEGVRICERLIARG